MLKNRRSQHKPNINPPRTCSACGGKDFTWGEIRAFHTFRRKDAGVLEPPQPVSARRCNRCGKLLLFSPAPDKSNSNGRK